ncbi:MAG: hypothetical protein VX476_04530 [Actinomycetota bacterium]|nr:hypothetical protein [Actinomycetota bacterium]MED5277163.1 hypothetical protein [Actinomycetota bacterium]
MITSRRMIWYRFSFKREGNADFKWSRPTEISIEAIEIEGIA